MQHTVRSNNALMYCDASHVLSGLLVLMLTSGTDEREKDEQRLAVWMWLVLVLHSEHWSALLHLVLCF